MSEVSDHIICFSKGTAILTPAGDRPVETLRPGDLVITLDHGPQPIRWVGARSVPATGALAPVHFERGTIGNDRDLLVSPYHRVLIDGMPGRPKDDLLVPALALVDNYRVSVKYGGIASYHHMLFDSHQIVVANGAFSESFHPQDASIQTLDARAQHELFQTMPWLRSDIGSYGEPSRQCLNLRQASALR